MSFPCLLIIDARLPYVASVHPDRHAAVEALGALPADLQPRASLLDAPCPFPFFVLESHARGFSPTAPKDTPEALAALRAASTTPPIDGVHALLYLIAGPWEGDDDGRDAMGALPHRHIEDDDLAVLAAEGLEGLWPRWRRQGPPRQ